MSYYTIMVQIAWSQYANLGNNTTALKFINKSAQCIVYCIGIVQTVNILCVCVETNKINTFTFGD